MWIFTQTGFVSAVRHRSEPDTLMVRARDRESLVALAELVDAPIEKLAHGFRTVGRDVDADLPEHLDRLGMHVTGRLRARAVHVDQVAGRGAEDALGEVAAAGVAGTEDEDLGLHAEAGGRARAYHARVPLQTRQTESMTGTSTSTPTIVASAAPEVGPKSVIATATASSKKLLAPISAPGEATLCGTFRARINR